MADPKKVAKKRSSAKRLAAQRRAAALTALQKRAAQDPFFGPSSKRIEQSFDKGKTVSLQSFRKIIDWS